MVFVMPITKGSNRKKSMPVLAMVISFTQLLACGKRNAGKNCGLCEGNAVCLYGAYRSRCANGTDCGKQGMTYCRQGNICFASRVKAEELFCLACFSSKAHPFLTLNWSSARGQ